MKLMNIEYQLRTFLKMYLYVHTGFLITNPGKVDTFLRMKELHQINMQCGFIISG